MNSPEGHLCLTLVATPIDCLIPSGAGRGPWSPMQTSGHGCQPWSSGSPFLHGNGLEQKQRRSCENEENLGSGELFKWRCTDAYNLLRNTVFKKMD